MPFEELPHTGKPFGPARHPFRTEVKAVTYHGAEVRRVGEEWEGVFTLDL